MKEFFEQCLRDLEPLTGKRQVYYWQTETEPDATGKPKGARKFEVCVMGMVTQSKFFSYIPETDQKRIISEMMVKDQEYEALNSSVVFKWLSMYKDKYFTDANAPGPERLHEYTEEEKQRIDKLANEFKAQLVGQTPNFKGIEKDIEALKREDAERVEKKAISANRKINEEHIRQREKLAEIAKERGLDKLGLHEISKFQVEDKLIVARNLQEAREIYIEVYEN
jgi:hypothetical protein